MLAKYPAVLEQLKKVPFNVMLDIGTRGGGEIHYLLEHFPDLYVLGLEPDEEVRVQFCKNHPDIEVIPKGVWSHPTKKTLIKGRKCPSMKLEGTGPTVDCITLDEVYFKWLSPTDDILLWIDIEGSELEAFKGGVELLSSGDVKFIYTELRTKENLRSASWSLDVDVLAELKCYGYEPILIQPSEKDYYDVLLKLEGC